MTSLASATPMLDETDRELEDGHVTMDAHSRFSSGLLTAVVADLPEDTTIRVAGAHGPIEGPIEPSTTGSGTSHP